MTKDALYSVFLNDILFSVKKKEKATFYYNFKQIRLFPDNVIILILETIILILFIEY